MKKFNGYKCTEKHVFQETYEPGRKDVDRIAALARMKRAEPALNWGGFRSVVLTNRQCIFERRCDDECIWVAVNADDQSYWAQFSAPQGEAEDLLTGRRVALNGGAELPPYSAAFWKF